MTDQLELLNKHEANPYRPDVPEDFRAISPHLYDFLRETAETLREQHNVSQAGDSTFSWEILTQVDMKRRYNPGSLGKFYHPTYGIIHARYCRFSGMKETTWFGAPVGIRVDGSPLSWAVTNDLSKSNRDLCVGLCGAYVFPPEDSYGWVICNGPNIQSVAVRKRTNIAQFDKFVWGATDRLAEAPRNDGRVVGSILGLSNDITEIRDNDIDGDYFLATVEDREGTEEWMRFAPLFWTTNFPATMIASLTTVGNTLQADGIFYKSNDLAGIIWESEDHWDHPLTKYDTNKDYSNCQLRFTIEIEGDTPDLANVNGPVLTIEGRAAGGGDHIWYVRLINYRTAGNNTTAEIYLDFDNLAGGFGMDDPVYPLEISRMFIGFVAAGYSTSPSPTYFDEPQVARIKLSNIECTGSNATLVAGSGRQIHALRMTNGYDDTYNLTPERLVRNTHKLGYRKWFNHYVGMSHYFYWEWNGSRYVTHDDVDNPLNTPCQIWHKDLTERLQQLEFQAIFSISYEMLNSFMPTNWRQLDSNGLPALTGWEPPSSLFSPCNPDAMTYLDRVYVAFADILANAGMPVHIQVGEPWWWVDFRTQKPYFYDPITTSRWEEETGLPVPIITDMKQEIHEDAIAFLNWLGDRLAESTLNKIAAVRDKYPDMVSYVLVYLPQILSGYSGEVAPTPEAKRVNMPLGWAKPAFDVLQLEDYDFVIENRPDLSEAGRLLAEERLGYSRDDQQYFSGFVLFKEDSVIWDHTSNAIRQAWEFGVPEVFVWAYTQVMRDGYVNLLDPDTLYRQWNVPAGFLFVDFIGDSEQRIRGWIKQSLESVTETLRTFQIQLNILKGSQGLGGLTVRVGLAESKITGLERNLALESKSRALSFKGFEDRLSAVERKAGVTGAAKEVDLKNLTYRVDSIEGLVNTRLQQIQDLTAGYSQRISDAEGLLTQFNSEMIAIRQHIADVKFYVGQILRWKVQRVLPTVDTEVIEVGNFTTASGAHNLRISISGNGVSKEYQINTLSAALGVAWLTLQPSVDAGGLVDLEGVQSDSTLYLRLRGRGASSDNENPIYVQIESAGHPTETFSDNMAVTAESLPINVYYFQPPITGQGEIKLAYNQLTDYVGLTVTNLNDNPGARSLVRFRNKDAAGQNQVFGIEKDGGIGIFDDNHGQRRHRWRDFDYEIAKDGAIRWSVNNLDAVAADYDMTTKRRVIGGVTTLDTNKPGSFNEFMYLSDLKSMGVVGSSLVLYRRNGNNGLEIANDLISSYVNFNNKGEYWLDGVKFAYREPGYHTIADYDGSPVMFFGGAADPVVYFTNTAYSWADRAYTTEYMYLDSAGLQVYGDVRVNDAAYGSGWNGSSKVPTRNAVYDKIESLTFTGLADVPDSYVGSGLYFPQIKADGSGLQFVNVRQLPTGGTAGQILQKFGSGDNDSTWSNLTAGIVSFTPVGGISATNVQDAIAELQSDLSARLLPTGGASQTILQKYGAGDGEATWSALTAGIVGASANGYATVQDAITDILSQLSTQLGYIYGHGNDINNFYTAFSGVYSRLDSAEARLTAGGL